MGYSSYSEYLCSEEWKIKSNKRKEIDNYQCQICLSDKELRVHHKTYQKCLWMEGVCNENIDTDLITLCDSCHKKIHETLKVLKYINSDYFVNSMSDFVLRGFIMQEFADREIMFGGDLNFSNLSTPNKIIYSLFGDDYSKKISPAKIRDFFVEIKRRIAREAFESGKSEKVIMKSLGMTKQAFDNRNYKFSKDIDTEYYKSKLFYKQHEYISDLVLNLKQTINDFEEIVV